MSGNKVGKRLSEGYQTLAKHSSAFEGDGAGGSLGGSLGDGLGDGAGWGKDAWGKDAWGSPGGGDAPDSLEQGGKKGSKKGAQRGMKTNTALKRAAAKLLATRPPLPLELAIVALTATGRAKFNETLEVAMNLGIDPRHADQQVRGTVVLPHGTGKTLRVAVFARDEKAEQAKNAGADIVGAEDLVERVAKGEIPFDRCIATPDLMGLVGRLGKILGPRNLMPNPKLGTVTANVAAAVAAAKGGEVQFRAEKNGVIHAGVGRMSFSKEQLVENVATFVAAIIAMKPEGVKGTYLKKITLATTMGAGIAIDSRSITVA